VFGTVPVTLAVCNCCGHLMMVEHDLTLRELTTEEHREAINRSIFRPLPLYDFSG
jgi:hypothetical protein